MTTVSQIANTEARKLTPVTPNQEAFITTLIRERQVPELFVDTMRAIWTANRFDAAVASIFISRLNTFPLKEGVVPSEGDKSLIGMHQVGDTFFEVAQAKKSKRLYASRLVFEASGEVSKVYDPEVIKDLSKDTLL